MQVENGQLERWQKPKSKRNVGARRRDDNGTKKRRKRGGRGRGRIFIQILHTSVEINTIIEETGGNEAKEDVARRVKTRKSTKKKKDSVGQYFE